MKINFEVIHSCTIKRKKPWSRISWIGKEKEKLFLLDSKRISLIDPKNGKTRRRISRLSSIIKQIVSFNTSDDGAYFVGILLTGDLIVWHKDTDSLRNITGRNEFSLRLGFHVPSVFISNDSKKIILITSRNKVFVWETDRFNANLIEGNWSDIVACKDIKTVEDNKELVLDIRFVQNQINGCSATCCFVFNYDNKPIVNVLKIKWLSQSELISQNQCRFETVWICYQPNDLKLNCLYTRGAYVLKLSHSADLLALACNQKLINNTSLVFMSVANGTILPVNLRNFGLNKDAKGRNYWIQELNWLFNDLYLIGISKHGALFLISRLGQPLLIHAFGKEINMGPALYLSIHPLIIIRGTSAAINQNDTSLNSAIENEDTLRQRYSITIHPNLPILLCSDGYLLCIFRIESAFSTQTRLMRELMHETNSLINESSQLIINKEFKSQFTSIHINNNENNELNDYLPDWSLNINQQIDDKQSDGDSNESEPDFKQQTNKIAEGKIIFSYLPQILPISQETMQTSSLVEKMESAFEYLKSGWTLLISTNTLDAAKNTHECDQTAKSLQNAFIHYSYLFQIYNNKNKIDTIIHLFVQMLKLLNFDPSSKFNTNSHMLIYIPGLVEKFIAQLLQIEARPNKSEIFQLIYCLINTSESILKSIYTFKTNKNFILNSDSILSQTANTTESAIITSNNKQKPNHYGTIQFIDLLFEKCWTFLIESIQNNKENDNNLLIILIEKRLQQLPAVFNTLQTAKQIQFSSIYKRKQTFKINKADMIYLAYGDLDQAYQVWLKQLNQLIEKLKTTSKLQMNNSYKKDLDKSIKIAHKIFYSCLENYELEKLIQFINSYLINDDDNCPFSLTMNTFKHVKPMKQFRKLPISIVSCIKSLARFMALYFINTKQILIHSVSNPLQMESILLDQSSIGCIKLSKQLITNCINSNLSIIFTSDKCLELFILTGLYDEAVYFLNLINDWKNSYLLSTILKETSQANVLSQLDNLPLEMQPEEMLTLKVCSFLGINTKNLLIMEKQDLDNIGSILKELLLCSVMTRVSILEQLLIKLMESFISLIQQLCSNNQMIVSDEFYLPAPPVYCFQFDSTTTTTTDLKEYNRESNIRIKLYSISKCIIMLLTASNLHVPLIKWYLESLKHSSEKMKQFQGISTNTFQLSFSLKILLTSIRFQKIGYIPNILFEIFRDFCACLFFLDCRDKFSHLLRQYTRIFIINQNLNESKIESLIPMCLKIIDYGCLLLNYKSFFVRQEQHLIIQDIVLSTISRLTRLIDDATELADLNLELKLANCIDKSIKTTNNENDDEYENFNLKLKKLTHSWTKIVVTKIDTDITMNDIYAHTLEVVQKSVRPKLVSLYGIGEECLCEKYNEKKQLQQQQQQQTAGGYDFERSEYGSEFLELFFKLSFDQTEDWECLIQAVNQTPLLPEFYDLIRMEQIPNLDYLDKQFVMIPINELIPDTLQQSRRRRSVLNSNEFQHNQQIGLFRSYSTKSVNTMNEIDELKNVNNLVDLEDKENIRTDKPLKIIDYGPKYVQIANLSIWLMKWSIRFQKLIMKHKFTSSFWDSSASNSEIITLKLNSINANFLICSRMSLII